ncbi:hypothetical protein, partial [Kingella kingae]|uniref:hypothetical protein n=1 Tax=Kingella kingae TaxID=504 RepID=UPI001AD7F9BC
DSYVSGSQPIQPSLPLVETATHSRVFRAFGKNGTLRLPNLDKIECMLTRHPIQRRNHSYL